MKLSFFFIPETVRKSESEGASLVPSSHNRVSKKRKTVGNFAYQLHQWGGKIAGARVGGARIEGEESDL